MLSLRLTAEWIFCTKNGVTPDIIVGDFDSTTTNALEYFERKGQTEIRRLNPIKDDTDTEYAIRLAISEGARSIVLLEHRQQNRPCAWKYFTFGNRPGKWN